MFLPPYSCTRFSPSSLPLRNAVHRAPALLRAELLPRRYRVAYEQFVAAGAFASTDPLGERTINLGLSARRGHKMAAGLAFINGHAPHENFLSRQPGRLGKPDRICGDPPPLIVPPTVSAGRRLARSGPDLGHLDLPLAALTLPPVFPPAYVHNALVSNAMHKEAMRILPAASRKSRAS